LLLASVAAEAKGFLVTGRRFVHLDSNTVLDIEIEPPDPRLEAAFKAAGAHWVSARDLKRIRQHKQVIYLVGECGSDTRAGVFMLAASAVLRAGGHSVKVESSGLAHSRAKWLQLTHNHYLFRAHEAFVLYVTGDDVFSCGMHNLGLPDAIIRSNASSNPVALLRTFTYYLFTESPVVRNGQTFAAAKGEPGYRLFHEASSPYPPGDLFANPYGVWRLEPL
jgi:hypothetical protein